MAEQPIKLTVGEKGSQTITIEDYDGTPYDLSGEGGYAVKIYVRNDRDDDAADNIVDGASLTVVTAASGICRWDFDFSASTHDEVSGHWRCRIVSVDTTVDRLTRRQPFTLARNPYW